MNYLEAIRHSKLLGAEEEIGLIRNWRQQRDPAAAEQLVTSHLRLVVRIAADFRGYGFPIPEMIAEGNIGLMQALYHFDPEKGARFATYAAWWIKARIQEFILHSWSLVKLGTTSNQRKLFFKLRGAKSRILALNGGDLRRDQAKQIAEDLGVSEREVVEMDRRLVGDESLNTPNQSDNDGTERQDWLVDATPSPERALVDRDQRAQLHKTLTSSLEDLNARERRIFVARQLIDQPIGLKALADEFSISPERVRKIELRAFEKVKFSVIKRAALFATEECAYDYSC